MKTKIEIKLTDLLRIYGYNYPICQLDKPFSFKVRRYGYRCNLMLIRDLGEKDTRLIFTRRRNKMNSRVLTNTQVFDLKANNFGCESPYSNFEERLAVIDLDE